MTHYEVLGVAPDAPPEELRRAYLRQARRHHPDRHAATGTVDRGTAERRMRELNEAWSVLRDPARRAEYDLRLRSGSAGIAPTVADRHVVNTPSRDFTPLYAEDEDDDDRWRYEADEYDPRTGLGRLLGVAPALLVLAGLGLLAAGLVVRLDLLTALGAAALLLGVLSFALVPMVALFRSQQHEGRPADGGGRPRR